MIEVRNLHKNYGETVALKVLSSAALLGSFRSLWGGGTLHVNARFTVPPRGDHQRFRAFAQIAIRNNHGGRYPDLPVRARRAWQWLKSSVCRRAS